MDLRTLNASLPAKEVLGTLRMLIGHYEGLHWRGGCPFHQSRSPHSRSLAVNVHLRKFFCHRCRAHGDLVDLYAHLMGLTLHHAAVQLRERFLASREQEDGTEGTVWKDK
jgi:hypothetical protein